MPENTITPLFDVLESDDRLILKRIAGDDGDFKFKLHMPRGCEQKALAFVVIGSDFDDACAQNPSLSPSKYLGGPYAYSKAVKEGGELSLGPIHLEIGWKFIIRKWDVGGDVGIREILPFVGIEVEFELGRLVRRVA